MKDETAIPEGLKTGFFDTCQQKMRVLAFWWDLAEGENAFKPGDIAFLSQ